MGAAGQEALHPPQLHPPPPVSPAPRGGVPRVRGAEMADEIDWLDLPGRWTYGVDRGGRIFFIKYVGLSRFAILCFLSSCPTWKVAGRGAG